MSILEQSAASVRSMAVAERRKGNGDALWRGAILAVLLVGSVIMLLPFVWLVISSLKPQTQIFIFPPEWIPREIRWQNYVEALIYKPFGLYIWNTLKIVILNEIAILLAASFCGYGFARITFPGRDFWFGLVMATLMIPYVVLMVPQFIIFTRLGWIDTILPLTFPFFFGGGAFNIFLFRQFFRTLPEELADAGRIDGCSEFGIYWKIMMPLCRPALATIAVFTFLNGWNDYLAPLLYLRSDYNFTVTLGLATFRSIMNTRWDLLMAASTAMILPIILLFFFAQRYFVEGVVLSGLKG